MKLSDLDPVVQAEVLRVAHDYTKTQRDVLSERRRVPTDEPRWYREKLDEAVSGMLALYKSK
ncbi:Putative phage protein [Xenorhabdus bovienii]|uniref:Putative phage protein n=1 Tax=Xenorhabdus bovienii TaxID=40576 RepID=A0A0B6X4W8_XENBV|nr:Putative phage protein [Xenorhabdus bovienii]